MGVSALGPRDALADARGHPIGDAVLLQNRGGVGESRGVGRGGAGADDVEVVADHIGKQQRFHSRRSCEARQLPAFDPRDMFADGVDLVDIGAAGQQQARDGLLLFERDRRGRQRQQRRCAAGDQADDQIVLLCGRCDRRDALRARRRRARRAPGWPHSFSSMRRSLAVCPSLTFTRPAVMRRPRTRSAAFAMDAPAFPAPTT